MSDTKRGRLTEKKKQSLALQVFKGMKGFQKKSKGAEMLKNNRGELKEIEDREFMLIKESAPTDEIQSLEKQVEGPVSTDELSRSALLKANLAINALTDVLNKASNQYVTIKASLALLKWVKLLVPDSTLKAEEPTREFFMEINPDDIKFYDTDLNDYPDDDIPDNTDDT